MLQSIQLPDSATGFHLNGVIRNRINLFCLNNRTLPGVDSSPCLSSYNWAFRISLLTISILCICLIFCLTYYIYKYRKIKVFKVASPVFLSITLLGCAVMYAEVGRERMSTIWTPYCGFRNISL